MQLLQSDSVRWEQRWAGLQLAALWGVTLGLGWLSGGGIRIQGAFKVHLHSGSLGALLVLLSGVVLAPRAEPGLGLRSLPCKEENYTGVWRKPSPPQRGWSTCKASQPMGLPTPCLLVAILLLFFSLSLE